MISSMSCASVRARRSALPRFASVSEQEVFAARRPRQGSPALWAPHWAAARSSIASTSCRGQPRLRVRCRGVWTLRIGQRASTMGDPQDRDLRGRGRRAGRRRGACRRTGGTCAAAPGGPRGSGRGGASAPTPASFDCLLGERLGCRLPPGARCVASWPHRTVISWASSLCGWLRRLVRGPGPVPCGGEAVGGPPQLSIAAANAARFSSLAAVFGPQLVRPDHDAVESLPLVAGEAFGIGLRHADVDRWRVGAAGLV